ncbi:hypothetical protein D9M73_299550 [compost metagenome]
MAADPEGPGYPVPQAIQLPAHLCDNVLNVRNEPRLHRATTGQYSPDAALHVRPLDQLRLRLERNREAGDRYQIGIVLIQQFVSY